MSPFEYVIVLVSIILGLGITTILTGVADLIKHVTKRKLYAPYLIWIFLVFVLHFHEWWDSYSLRSIETWTLPIFLFIILYPINLYILAHLLFPSDTRQGTFDMEEFYWSNYPKFFISAIFLVLLSIIHNLTIEGLRLQDQIIHFSVLIISLTIVLTKTKSSLIHAAVSLLLLVIMLASLFLVRESLIIQ